MTTETEEGRIRLKDLAGLVKRLRPGKIGQFEPLSGIIVLNMDMAAFTAMFERVRANAITESDRLHIRVINHESCHFLQTCLSGYMFDRARRLFDVFNAEDKTALLEINALEEQAETLVEQHKEAFADDPDLTRRFVNTVKITFHTNRQAILSKYARDDDHTLAGALMPEFFEFREALLEEEGRQNADGLSVLGVVEGAAVAYSCVMEGHGQASNAEMEAEFDALSPVYSELWRIVKPAAGPRAAELVLPLAAIALCYEKPHHACLGLLPMLLDQPERAHELSRALFDDLPDLPAAGQSLGGGRAIRARNDDFRLYDSVLSTLENDPAGLSNYELLAEPMAFNRVTQFPVCITLLDDFVHAGMPNAEVAAKVLIASMVLQVSSRRREERDFQSFAVSWGREVIGRLMDGMDEQKPE